MSEESNIVVVTGETDEEVTMKIKEFVTFENKDYVLMSVIENGVEQEETIIMKAHKTDNEYTFEMFKDNKEDNEEFNNLVNALNEDEEDDDEE